MFFNKTIKLYWSGGRNGHVNYGDLLSKYIIAKLTNKEIVYKSPSEADICSIGSILERVWKHSWKRPFKGRLDRLIVWGSGTIDSQRLGWNPFVNIVSVRGPLTRQQLNCGDEIMLGDPGLLCDLLLEHKKPEKAYSVGIVPHNVDFNHPHVSLLNSRIPKSVVIDLSSSDIVHTTSLIASCDAIISSSLHGIIAADALNIPRARLKFSDLIEGGDHKFKDHDASVSIFDASALDPLDISAENIKNNLMLPDGKTIQELKNGLMKSFNNIGI